MWQTSRTRRRSALQEGARNKRCQSLDLGDWATNNVIRIGMLCNSINISVCEGTVRRAHAGKRSAHRQPGQLKRG